MDGWMMVGAEADSGSGGGTEWITGSDVQLGKTPHSPQLHSQYNVQFVAVPVQLSDQHYVNCNIFWLH